MSYTEKFCAEIPLVGPAAQHFVGLSCALSGQLSLASFEKLPQDVQDNILADIAVLSSEDDPKAFMSDVREDADARSVLFPLPSESRYASVTLFENEDLAMPGYRDNWAFTIMRESDQLYVAHVDGYSFSQNISPILSTTLERYAPDVTVSIRYGMDSEEVRTDAYGGGAVALSKDGSRTFSSLDAMAFSKLLLVGDEPGLDGQHRGQYRDQRNLVNKMLEGLSAQEQQQLLGTLLHVVKDLEPVVAERLEHERDLQASDFSPS